MQTDIGTLTPEQMLQQQQILRQQKMAEMLMQKGMEQPQGQMISGHYVRPSIFQNLAGLANTYVGQRGIEKGEQAQLDLAKAIREQKMGVLENINQALDAGDLKKARGIATANPEYGKDFIAPLLENTIPKKTTEMINYEAAKADPVMPFKGSFNDFKNQMTQYQREELALKRQAQTNELAGGKPTESQAKAGLYRSQMVSATNALNNLYEKGFDPSSPVAQVQTGLAGGIFNVAASPEARQAKQAQNQWTEAYLRFKTGAGTNASEIELNRKTYFPTNMDDADTIKLKADMRAQAERDMAIAAGPTARFGAQITPPTATKTDTPAAPAAKKVPSLWGEAKVVSN